MSTLDSVGANSNSTVNSWLKTINLPEYTKILTENGFDSIQIIINNINNQILQDMGIKKIGHRLEIMKQIELLRNQLSSTEDEEDKKEHLNTIINKRPEFDGKASLLPSNIGINANGMKFKELNQQLIKHSNNESECFVG
eukprot:505707_1